MSICLWVRIYVCLQNFVDSVSQELVREYLWNSIFLDIILVLIRFWCLSLKNFRCYYKFLITLKQWYRAKLCAIVPNADYFEPIILKFITFIYNSNSKITHNFCIYRGNTPPVGGKDVTLSGEKFFTVGIFRKNTSKYVKLMNYTSVIIKTKFIKI